MAKQLELVVGISSVVNILSIKFKGLKRYFFIHFSSLLYIQ